MALHERVVAYRGKDGALCRPRRGGRGHRNAISPPLNQPAGAVIVRSKPFDLERNVRYIESTMKDTLTITQGQAQLPALCRKQRTTAITRNGQVVSFIVPRQRMSDLLEQMEILANPAAMKAIKKARAGRGKFHPLSVLDEN
jgi:hypothetical protein